MWEIFIADKPYEALVVLCTSFLLNLRVAVVERKCPQGRHIPDHKVRSKCRRNGQPVRCHYYCRGSLDHWAAGTCDHRLVAQEARSSHRVAGSC